MSKILIVTGATSLQGDSVIHNLLQQTCYKTRAITRNPSSAKAQALSALGIEFITADLKDEPSLLAAFTGTTAIFAVTNFYNTFGAGDATTCVEKEYTQDTNMARAASQIPTLEHYIWSTLRDPVAISTSEDWLVPHFTGKGRVDEFIKWDASLLPKTTFLSVVYYGSNFQYPFFTPAFFMNSPFLPSLAQAGKYIHLMPCASDTPISSVGVAEQNVGLLTGAILTQLHLTLGGKYVYGKADELTTGEFLKLWEDFTGKTAAYVQVTEEAYRSLWAALGNELANMLRWWEHEKVWGYTVMDGVVLLEQVHLGLKEGDLASTKEAMGRIDWKVVLGE